MEAFSDVLDFKTVSPEVLATKLRRFYCEAKPKSTSKRSEELTYVQAENYHKNSLKSIRSAINRYLQDLKRSMDIVRDKDFKSANHTLDGMLKEMTKTGESRATNHKPVIHPEDLERISSYFLSAPYNPIVLRQCVWYHLSIHLVTRGLEFHHQLRTDSFLFQKDENNRQYVTLCHETQQKNFQGGIRSEEALSGKRIYEVPESEICPVKMLRLLLSKTDSSALSLFNSCFKDALHNPSADLWYTSKPLAKRSFSGFMSDICKSSKCMNTYTPHCLRATSITAMSDQGFESRQIMYMSGHRCEASLKTYNRHLSDEQKRSVSSCLSNVTNPNHNNRKITNLSCSSYNMSIATTRAPSASLSVVPREEIEGNPPEMPSYDASCNSSVRTTMSSEILAKSVLNHCVFNFNK